jgi:hypothetical protein
MFKLVCKVGAFTSNDISSESFAATKLTSARKLMRPSRRLRERFILEKDEIVKICNAIRKVVGRITNRDLNKFSDNQLNGKDGINPSIRTLNDPNPRFNELVTLIREYTGVVDMEDYATLLNMITTDYVMAETAIKDIIVRYNKKYSPHISDLPFMYNGKK